MIHPSSVPLLVKEFIHFFSKEGLSEKLEFLNPDVIIRQVEDVVEKCEKKVQLKIECKNEIQLDDAFGVDGGTNNSWSRRLSCTGRHQ